ncbi:MAG TPA: phosphoribosyl-AMP cyclohydrolase [Planctomycetota bacterium]|nr:phosphoribosyl-AMP cyclohydrolase [Planctomycetota bacterium]
MGGGVEFYERMGGREGTPAFLDALKWDRDGLVAVVSQDARSGEVLGVAFADRTALAKTFETGLMHYYSRSRRKLWLKGEESGHVQKLVELRTDCDGDAILAKVRQVKGNCHLGFFSCFSYALSKSRAGKWTLKSVGKKVFDPKKVYKTKKS